MRTLDRTKTFEQRCSEPFWVSRIQANGWTFTNYFDTQEAAWADYFEFTTVKDDEEDYAVPTRVSITRIDPTKVGR